MQCVPAAQPVHARSASWQNCRYLHERCKARSHTVVLVQIGAVAKPPTARRVQHRRWRLDVQRSNVAQQLIVCCRLEQLQHLHRVSTQITNLLHATLASSASAAGMRSAIDMPLQVTMWACCHFPHLRCQATLSEHDVEELNRQLLRNAVE